MAQRYGAPAPWRRRAAVIATVVLERRATAVEKVGCTADGQKRPR